MVDLMVLSDPIISTVFFNLVSTGIAEGFSKATKKIFRKQDIEDYLNKISIRDRLDQEIDFEISNFDVESLNIFFKSEEIIEIFSQIYLNSDKSLPEIENQFVQRYCEINPINEQSNKVLARKIFNCINIACKEIIQSKIVQGELIAHEYQAEARHKEDREIHDRIEKKVTDIESLLQDRPGTISINVKVEYLDDELKESIALINTNQYEDAKTKIYAVIGILENKPQDNKKLLSKAYHLLAIVYNRHKENGGNFDKAEQYANISLKYDLLNDKVKGTLASVYLNKGGKENITKSFSIITQLREQSDENNTQFLAIYLWGLCLTKSAEEAITFFERSVKAQDITKLDDILSNIIARFYILINNPRQSLKYINNSITLDPKNPDHYLVKASAYREIAAAEDYISSDFELLADLKKTDCVETALYHYQTALSLCTVTTDSLLKEKIKKEIYICSSLLKRSNEREFQNIRSSINLSYFPENEQKSLELIDFINELNQRNFSTSYEKLIHLKDWDKFPYETKFNIGLIFLNRGRPEEARKIFKFLEKTAESKKDIQYWLKMSIIEGLLENKTTMLQNLEKAKKCSDGTDDEERVLSHNCVMMQRDLESRKEIHRMLTSFQEYDKKFPEREVLKVIPVNENNDKPFQEILELFSQIHEQYQKDKKIVTENGVPSYLYADKLCLPYAKFLNSLKDPTFQLKYYPIGSFQKEMVTNFEDGETFVFDYSSLLNLSKMDLLGELEKIERKLVISKSLFEKIQLELISYENADLRKLWNFLRTSNNILIHDCNTDLTKYTEISEIFEKWIIDTIKLTLSKENSVLVSDDFNLILLLRQYKIKGTVTINFLIFLFEHKFIDKISYGIAIGALAERMYIYLPFDGEDLFQVVMEDGCKIELRSYHLINHITIPEIQPLEYTRQLCIFIGKLWRSGSIFDDKIKWVSLITERITFTIIHRLDSKQIAEVDFLRFDLIQIWKKIISLSELSELTILERECSTLFKDESLKSLEESILSLIKQRRAKCSLC